MISSFFVFGVLFNSCSKDEDPCDDINCGSHGICGGGNCHCDIGWSGSNCSFEDRTIFLGDYTAENDCASFSNSCDITIARNEDQDDHIDISNIGCFSGAFTVVAELYLDSAFRIESQVVSNTTFIGNGYLDGDSLFIDYRYTPLGQQQFDCDLRARLQ